MSAPVAPEPPPPVSEGFAAAKRFIENGAAEMPSDLVAEQLGAFSLRERERIELLDLHAGLAATVRAASEPPSPARRNGARATAAEPPPPARSAPAPGQAPPHNPEAEESILGAMMISATAIAAVRGEVDAGDFYRESHARIFQTALDLHDRGDAVDAITLADFLEERGELDDVGGRVRIHELAVIVPASANAAHWARIVREMATLRGLIHAGGVIQRLGWERPGELPELEARAQEALDAATTASRSRARPRLRVVPIAEFAAVEEASTRPLLGSVGANLLPADGLKLVYGEAGVGKTSLAIDGGVHLASGTAWLGLDVAAPVRILLIENEGPRGPVRRKLDAKAAAWDGPDFQERLHVLEEPWATVSFADAALRRELAAVIADLNIELVIAGPLSRLGTEGGGTLAEVAAFEHHLAELRALVDRSLAFWLVHHENKAGGVSGAWERVPDTFVHVKLDGRERSTVRWQKCRWAPDLHGRRWTLAWRPGERYEIVDQDGLEGAERRAVEQEAALTWLAEHVQQHFAATSAGIARNTLVQAYQDAHDGKGRNLARRVIGAQIKQWDRRATGEDSATLATGPGEVKNGIYLYPASHAPSPLADAPNGEGGEGASDPRQEAQPRHVAARPKGGEGGAASEGGEPDESELSWR